MQYMAWSDTVESSCEGWTEVFIAEECDYARGEKQKNGILALISFVSGIIFLIYSEMKWKESKKLKVQPQQAVYHYQQPAYQQPPYQQPLPYQQPIHQQPLNNYENPTLSDDKNNGEGSDKILLIKQLTELKEKGVLSDDEFSKSLKEIMEK